MTASDLIASALRLIGVLAAGEPIPPDSAGDALSALNSMIDGWNADGLAVFTTQSNDFPFVAGKQVYTLGTGGDFNITRPAYIDSMSAIITNNPDNPVEVPMTEYTVDDWQTKVPVKNVSGSFPQLYYDDGNFPLRAISFWPIPSQANSVRIYSWQPLAAQTFTSQIKFPPGYEEAFRFNLAVRLAAEYAAPVPAVVAQGATEAMARVKRMNMPELEIQSDLVTSPAGYNYRADMFGIPY
jgi:hypothetical protein